MTETWRAALGAPVPPEPADDLELTVAGPAGGVSIVHIVGEVHAGNAVRLEEVLEGAVRAGADMVVIDASAMTFLDSTGLGVLVSASRRLGEFGGKLGMSNVPRSLRRLLEISGVDRVIAHIESRSAGVAHPD